MSWTKWTVSNRINYFSHSTTADIFNFQALYGFDISAAGMHCNFTYPNDCFDNVSISVGESYIKGMISIMN